MDPPLHFLKQFDSKLSHYLALIRLQQSTLGPASGPQIDVSLQAQATKPLTGLLADHHQSILNLRAMIPSS